jgi:hypothetical protein
MDLFQSSSERSGEKLLMVRVSTLSPEDVNRSMYRNTYFSFEYEKVGKAQESSNTTWRIK